ncbi:ATPase, T2SS/T4P/T4SS family [Nannocystis sp.]|uniref:ATPase, T2SS/T4P/T4SS family n=1 Tax=Nannocystis sp. TaxID=1962667 RepID=UPI0025D63215|nr:ATPase, T2SS/T4P/T4SS family [Nannocystis sp.]MBK7826492.1 Flp pilus assembly complex ATPase component TadA [Nannocystis sp.]
MSRASRAGLWAARCARPDIILVGEMRDQDTIAVAALTVAETGHLVPSTLHAAQRGDGD